MSGVSPSRNPLDRIMRRLDRSLTHAHEPLRRVRTAVEQLREQGGFSEEWIVKELERIEHRSAEAVEQIGHLASKLEKEVAT